MRIAEVPVVDMRGQLTAQRGRLLSLLASLNDAQWAVPTAAPEWSVKDIAMHLLDVNLSWLARDRDDQQPDEYLPLVLRTFIWGFPHQYQAPAPDGTVIAVEIPDVGAWTLTRTATGWTLDEGQAATPTATLRMTGEAAWRLLTGARYDDRQVHLSGDPALAGHLLQVRGIIA